MEFEYNITVEDAIRRANADSMVEVVLLDKNSPEYATLSDKDKIVLHHLCRASFWLDRVDYKLQNAYNLDFYHFVADKVNNGDEHSKNIMKIFLGQKGINSLDTNGDMVNLAKGIEDKLGKNFYHFDLTPQQFHDELESMIDNGKITEVQKILSARTIVEYSDGVLTAIDYVDYFAEEFSNCANELILASQHCVDVSFREYLLLQADALTKVDPMLDAKADLAWAKLTGRLEFTITRESYEDELTITIFANDRLNNKLKANGIEVNPKDSIGCRVGIVNAEGTELLNTLHELNNIACELMPYKEEYSRAEDNSNPNQVAVDVDLVSLTGDSGAYRAGITLAENLPNSDKLAIKMGGGRRNAYHRQVRTTKSSELYNILIHPDYIKYYNMEACHWATIEHENTHSLGPKDLKALGEYASILEEYKADMGMYAFLEEYVKAGIFTEQQMKEIITTELYSNFSKAKPVMSQAHRVRSVMITQRLLTDGGIIYSDGKLSFDFGKVLASTKLMLAEVVRLQLDKSVAKAKEYVDRYFVWSDTHEEIAKIIRENSKKLNGEVIAPIYEESTKDLNL